jgi:hypothetical protein
VPDPRLPDPREQAAFAGAPPPGAPWRQGPSFGGGSFLGTAASTAAGVIGGSLLLDGIRSMMGGHHGSFGLADPASGASPTVGSPWDSGAGGDLSRQAGINDIGRDQHAGAGGDSRAGLFDNSPDADAPDPQDDQDVGSFDDSGSDFAGGDLGGGGDYSDA